MLDSFFCWKMNPASFNHSPDGTVFCSRILLYSLLFYYFAIKWCWIHFSARLFRLLVTTINCSSLFVGLPDRGRSWWLPLCLYRYFARWTQAFDIFSFVAIARSEFFWLCIIIMGRSLLDTPFTNLPYFCVVFNFKMFIEGCSGV